MYKFRCYIVFTQNDPMLNTAVASVASQIREFSTEERPIVILNNSMVPLGDRLENKTDCIEIMAPTPLQCATTANWMVRLAHDNGEPFCMIMHMDAQMLPGALAVALAKYEEVKDQKYIAIFANGGFEMENIRFFYEENVWYDDFLFPFYFTDNHIGRIAALRGYVVVPIPSELIRHDSSHNLREDPVMRARNNLAFGIHGQLYASIWGGHPGAETCSDPFARGTCYPKP